MKNHLHFSFRNDFDLVAAEYSFYNKLPPKMQTELIRFLFKEFLDMFKGVFEDCSEGFVNRIVVSLSYKSFLLNEIIQSANSHCFSVYFITKGGVAACEPTSFREPICVYGPGSFINMYQVILDTSLELDFKAVEESSLCPAEGDTSERRYQTQE